MLASLRFQVSGFRFQVFLRVTVSPHHPHHRICTSQVLPCVPCGAAFSRPRCGKLALIAFTGTELPPDLSFPLRPSVCSARGRLSSRGAGRLKTLFIDFLCDLCDLCDLCGENQAVTLQGLKLLHMVVVRNDIRT